MLIKSITTLLLFNHYLDLMRADWMAQVVVLYLHSLHSSHLLQINARRVRLDQEERRGERGGGTPPPVLSLTRGAHTRPLPAQTARAHSRCSPGAAAGPLNPRVIQESGLTHTFLLQVWSNRQGAAVLATVSSHTPTARRGTEGSAKIL